VTVRGTSSGDARTVVTNPQGQFDVAALPSGKYQVEVQAQGFKKLNQGLTVQPSERASLDAKLDAGSASETVTVSAANGPAPDAGVVSGFIGGVAGGRVAEGTIENHNAARLSLNGKNLSPAQPATSAPAMQQAPVAAGAMASGMVTNGAISALGPVLPAFTVKDGVVQRCIGTECTPLLLPLGARAVSVAASGQTVMALDADGDVFLSNNQYPDTNGGLHWEQAKVQWLGKAVGLRLGTTPPAQPAMLLSQPSEHSAGGTTHGAVAQKRAAAPQVLPAIFELTNDRGQIWMSLDEGKTWVAK
jgi:hypothetical protein